MDTRREFLKKAAMLSTGVGMMNVLPASISRALAIDPLKGSTYLDAEHVVFLMQENRSFDHTYGTLQGVRGYNDPRAITLPDKNLVWLQSNRQRETYAPFRLDIKNTNATWMESLPHSWDNQVDARNKGRYDQWIESKKSGVKEFSHMPLTMGYYTREDIPFYYSLADAFTVCDHNFCSSLTGTTANRLYFWTGTIREEQHQQSPANLWNQDVDSKNSAGWKTFPERLEEHDISWKIYQNDISDGSTLTDEEDAWLGNFGDNPIEYFRQYNKKLSDKYITKVKNADEKKTLLEKAEKLTAKEKSIHKKAFTTNENDPKHQQLTSIKYNDGGTEREVKVPAGDVLHQFREDVKNKALPAVSWLVAPQNFSDHPSSAWYGAWYISEALDILTQDPEVWKKTIFILTYDENDGYFDHVPPFVAPDPDNKDTGIVSQGLNTGVEYVKGPAQQLQQEHLRDSSIGLGYRVPMVIASPWTRGGWVNSQVFDHTSSLQFVEALFSKKLDKKIREENISEWRRTICGDLTSAFRPYNGEKIDNPKFVERDPFIEGIHRAKFKNIPSNFRKLTDEEVKHANTNPRTSEFIPEQEKGIRNSNALPYELYADARLSADKKSVDLTLACGNEILGSMATGAPFQVYAPGIYKNEAVHVRSYAVAAADALHDSWTVNDFEKGQYHLRVYGPNGFYREYIGTSGDPAIDIRCRYDKLTGNLMVHTATASLQQIEVTDNAYGKKKQVLTVSKDTPLAIDVSGSYGWYDITVSVTGKPSFLRRYAGRVETGNPSKTDPFMGRVNT